MMNRLLAVLLTIVVLIGAFALWRGSTMNTSQPHIPMKGVAHVTPRA